MNCRSKINGPDKNKNCVCPQKTNIRSIMYLECIDQQYMLYETYIIS